MINGSALCAALLSRGVTDPVGLTVAKPFRTLNICYGWVFRPLLLMSADHSFGAAGFAHLTP
jgi:hypothetical protein